MAQIEILKDKKFTCALCGGAGIQPGSLKSRCIACRGKGEVKFESPVIQCFACRGKGRASPSLMLSCIHCRGVGVMEKSERGGDVAEVIGERLGEITKRLQWARKETEKKTQEIERRFKPIRPFMKEVGKESLWLNKLGNNIKRGWQSLWEN